MGIIKHNIVPLDQQLCENKRRFFRDIYMQHHVALCKFIRRFGLSEGDIEDLAQDVYLRVVRQNEPDKLNRAPRAYLYQVATNLYRDMLRRNSRTKKDQHMEFDENKALTSLFSPESDYQAQESLDTLKQAIRELSPQRRKVLLLHRFQNLKCQEISDDLNIPLRSVQRYLNEAISHCQMKLRLKE